MAEIIRRSRKTQSLVIMVMMYMRFECDEFEEFQAAVAENPRDFKDLVHYELASAVKGATITLITDDTRYKPSRMLWAQADRALFANDCDFKAAFAQLTSA